MSAPAERPASSVARTPSWVLWLLLLLGAGHVVIAALAHPLYQVSDEISYAAGAQLAALRTTDVPILRTCISPPDGSPWYFWMAGGKPAFHALGGQMLRAACAAGAGDAAPIVVRLVLGLSLLVVAGCAWQLTRLVAGGTLMPALAGLTVVTQPVLAKYSAAITPDSVANAVAAVAILVGARWLLLGPSWGRLGALLLTSLAAAALKDTCLFLVPAHAALVLVTVGPRLPWKTRWGVPAVLASAVVLLVVARLMPAAGYDLTSGWARAAATPLPFMGAVVADTTSRLPGFVSSMLTSLGGFGGTAAVPPPSLVVAGMAVWCLAAAGGLARLVTDDVVVPRRVLWYFLALLLTCLLQAPVRQVLLGMAEQHQGRWLFPVATPLACLMAVGLARVGGSRTWPLWVTVHMTMWLLATHAVLQFHVVDETWALGRSSLYLHGIGGMDMGIGRVFDQVVNAWRAVAPAVPTTLALLSCTVCGALLALQRPALRPTHHVHHADHR